MIFDGVCSSKFYHFSNIVFLVSKYCVCFMFVKYQPAPQLLMMRYDGQNPHLHGHMSHMFMMSTTITYYDIFLYNKSIHCRYLMIFHAPFQASQLGERHHVLHQIQVSGRLHHVYVCWSKTYCTYPIYPISSFHISSTSFIQFHWLRPWKRSSGLIWNTLNQKQKRHENEFVFQLFFVPAELWISCTSELPAR